ncbi:hypothetical protein MIMGU_mgv1a016091mg [Erythranthe guttata]|uniref:Uncharacterized protein n=1 Tax=Erythranthe guttata TaxID=4155 RepID=A0A022RY20_ERYGU|nr:hypothetical protein MIMGU_mgv1a016091mg [Erythranthe guttata]
MCLFVLEVCCNACKKPIKASQYAAHAAYWFFIFAELCKSFSSSVELEQELDAPAVNKKPPRKERKKLPMTKTSILFQLWKRNINFCTRQNFIFLTSSRKIHYTGRAQKDRICRFQGYSCIRILCRRKDSNEALC